MVKVTFVLPNDDWHRYGTETMWAESLGDGRYRICNIPFYVRDVSAEDVVIAPEEHGALVVSDVSARGGHSTYRIFLSSETDEPTFRRYWEPLGQLGCTYEHATRRLIAIDVPETADIKEVDRILVEALAEDIWDVDEGHRGHR